MSLQFCSLSSGSSGNSYLVFTEDTYILVDAGISSKKIAESLARLNLTPYDLSAVLLTHEHSDHIKGAEILSRKYGLPLYTNEQTYHAVFPLMKNTEGVIFYEFETNNPFTLNDIEIMPFPVSHDAVEPVGFSFYRENTKISIATDTGCINAKMMEEIISANLLILEANHDEHMLKMGKYPWFLKQRILSAKGHLSNEAAGDAIAHMIHSHPINRQILLAHLSRENNFPEMAHQTVKNVLEENNLFLNRSIRMDLLHRDQMSSVFAL